jgi:hypothetical protein
MANQQWVSLLNPGITSTGPGLTWTEAASTTAVLSPQTSVSNQDYATVQPGGQYLGWYVGMLIRITARGWITTNTTTGTLTLSLRANKNNSTAPASNVVLATANGITTGATAITGIQYKLEAGIRCTNVASSGNTVSTQGEFTLFNALAAVPANPIALSSSPPPGFALPLPNISGETAVAVDTTQLQGIELCATGTAASGTIACTQWLVETLD